MRLLIQRVSKAAVEVDGNIIAAIGHGFLVFIGITHSDTEAEVLWLAKKLETLRLFGDAEGKINASIKDCKGSALVVSQFTLYADCTAGRRPSFIKAAAQAQAKELYELFIQELIGCGIHVQNGSFGADMQVSLINDGPVTIMLEK